MTDWMDDLSEDWVSEHRSSSASTSPSQFHDSQRKSVLSERSQNEGNILANSVQRPRKGLARRSLSDASNDSQARFDTTARKSVSVSPPKSRQNNTPEWRRRLLQGDIGYGQQKDLFSPMGIENIFQKPAPHGSVQQAQQTKTRGLSFLKAFQSIPSSPPPWPPQDEAAAHPPPKFGTINGRQLHALDEEEEEESRQRAMDATTDKTNDTELHNQISSIPMESYAEERIFSNGSVVHHQEPNSRKVSLDSVRFMPSSRKPSEATSWNSSQSGDDFSPVFISKHNTSDGRIAYAPLDISRSQLEEQMRRLHASQPSGVSSASESNRPADESSLARIESENLPEDLPVGTPDLLSIGEFVSIKRGGYSDIGSFRNRPLSPSPVARPLSVSVEGPSMHHHSKNETDDSVTFPAAPTPPAAAPKTPHTNRTDQLLSPERAKSANSPLKLFGNHDTFTSARLQRRISELEGPDAEPTDESQSPPSRRATGDLSVVEEATFVGHKSDIKGARLDPLRQASVQRHFGEGLLDSHAFPDDQWSSPENSDLSEDLPSRSPSPDMFPPGYHQPFRFHVESPPAEFVDTFKSKRKSSKASGKGGLSISKRSERNKPRLHLVTDNRVTSQPSQLSQVSEGKRPLTPSPFKSPTPKRRRTVFHSELTAQAQEQRLVLTQETHSEFQSALGKKRKDARHGSERNTADPDTLAQRQILRPRNPTPSQRRRWEAQQALLAADIAASSSPGLSAIQEHLSAPPMPGESADYLRVRALASDLASFSEDVAQRKKSITTQDYLDEAMKLMSYLRSNRRPNSNLPSVNEQDSEQVLDELVGPRIPDLTLERPPTREGRPSGWRSRGPDKMDPHVLNHLRRFQDEDEEGSLGYTTRSTHHTDCGVEPIETITSDPPGIQIFGQSVEMQARSRSRSNSNPSGYAEKSIGTNGTNETKATHSSRTSIDSTMGRTTTSRKSENVATLAPDLVSHLIPEQVAGMTFDKEQGKWIKAKSPKKEKPTFDISGMTGSENDPFGDIPDLTVDSTEETKHLLLSKSAGRRPIGISPEDPSGFFSDLESRPLREASDVDPRLGCSPERSSPQLPLLQNPSIPITGIDNAQSSPQSELDLLESSSSEEGDIEHEISIYEGRDQADQKPPVRSFSVSLSSPAWGRRRKGLSPVLENSGVSARDYGANPPQATPQFQQPDNRQLSLSVRLTGVVSTKEEKLDLKYLPETPSKSDVTFYLSELPEFTLDQIDEREIQGRVLSKHNTVGPIILGTEDRYASGNDLLVKALQDTEADEPYWEDLRRADLHRQGLTSLHLLDVLCDRLEKLDVSCNALSQLAGAPHSLRSLSVQYNALTGLTSWGHLMNLQYLDVSHNRIESLEGFAGLIHLRELRADGNRIHNLKGIGELDGLLSLSLRSNQLTEADFEYSDLNRLESLDLGDNKLSAVRGLYRLPALVKLRLDKNHLSSFPEDVKPCLRLETLNVSHNDLKEIKLTTFSPKLRNLNLDNNKLDSTTGISQLEYLETLTMRAQSAAAATCNLDHILKAPMPKLSTLCLSENHIASLAIPHDWYSLRTLEVASCGIHDLPEDFGQSVPNLRKLNLNSNALKDLRPILNTKSLSVLHVAGNRLARLRKTAAVLSKLRHLKILDLRDNPFSIGFHPKPVETRVIRTLRDLPDEEQLKQPTDAGNDLDEKETLAFLLPPCDKDTDSQYFSRLDEGTKLRRRVYEMLLASNCNELCDVDGMPFTRNEVMVRDEIWDRLMLLGVLKKSGKVLNDNDLEEIP